MRKLARLLAGAGVVLAAGVALAPLLHPRVAAEDARRAVGQRLYAAECAGCHGTALEGQPRWWQPNAAGRLPAPPLDAGGHAWQHSDAQLEAFILHGTGGATAAPGYRSDMPAFAGRLSVAEARAVLAFVKQSWPEGMRVSQALLNPGGAAALAALLQAGGDWTFPPDCLDPAQRAAAGAATGPR